MGLFDTRENGSRHEARISPTKMILGVFAVIIFIGAVLLMLPVATASGEHVDFLTALFTSTSATCVTGLVAVDTLSYWTKFGQIIILVLIQCGGLGFMAFATVFSLAVHRRISLRERLIMTQSFSVDELSGVVRLARYILIRTLVAECIGTALLAIRFVPEYGVGEGLFKSVFHSVSAFCNAGFDIIGLSSDHIGSMSKYASDPLVCLTLVGLMVAGGLGFFVWGEIRSKKSFHSYSLHTKLVLIMTAALLITGTTLFMMFEFSNAETVGDMSFGGKLLSSLFQASTARTAGYYTFSQQGMTTSSKLVTVALMFIGGSPGSTAGGIKTVTFAVLVMTAVSVMRGKGEVTLFERRVPTYTILKSIAVFMVAAFFVSVASIIIVLGDGINMIDALFECVSAFSTTGLSTGITAGLNPLSKSVLILLMYLGRVGLLTVSIGLLAQKSPSKISYPEGKTIIG